MNFRYQEDNKIQCWKTFLYWFYFRQFYNIYLFFLLVCGVSKRPFVDRSIIVEFYSLKASDIKRNTRSTSGCVIGPMVRLTPDMAIALFLFGWSKLLPAINLHELFITKHTWHNVRPQGRLTSLKLTMGKLIYSL